MSEKDNERVRKELAKIDATELSDIDTPEWEMAKQDFIRYSKKRLLEVGKSEENKRKVRDQFMRAEYVPHLMSLVAPPDHYDQETV